VKFEAPRGTHDILPAEQPVWEHVVGEAELLCALYGYRRIQTPVFEDTALFARTSGQGSDVVQKEMYTFTDRGDRSLTLRPEGTAPICRAYLEHGLHREPQPQKLYTVAPMYRYSAPQKGRYREHWQLSVEAIGSDDPAIDAEVIQLYDALLGRLGVGHYTLRLNSIGDAACRPAYLDQLGAWVRDHEEELDAETAAKAATSVLRVFDNFEAKPAGTQVALAGAPKIGQSLCDACREHFDAVRAVLDAYGVRYELEPTLVRGLDYYTRTTWEFVGPSEGAQSTISGGGRYDGLIEEIGGPPTPGVGFGAGIERLISAVHEQPDAKSVQVFLDIDEEADRIHALRLMAQLRADGISCDTDYAGRSKKGRLTQASRLGARITVYAGRDAVTLQPRAGSPQRLVPYEDAVAKVKELVHDLA
jgi:histidyl-tRNA synthetase